MDWNLSPMTSGWSPTRGFCRCGCWAERTGLTGRLPAAMARRGFDPVFDQRQILVDLALVLILGGEAISVKGAISAIGTC